MVNIIRLPRIPLSLFKKLLIGVTFLLGFFTGSAQNSRFTSEYIFMPAVYNPAVSGLQENGLAITVSQYNQWVGVDGAPIVSTVFLDRLVGTSTINASMLASYSSIGGGQSVELAAIGAYHIPFVRYGDRLAFGLRASVVYLQKDRDKLYTKYSDEEPLLLDLGFHPNFDVGGAYYAENMYAGFSARTLIPLTFAGIEDQPTYTEWSPSFDLMGGYQHFISLRTSIKYGIHLLSERDKINYGFIISTELNKKLAVGVSTSLLSSWGVFGQYTLNEKWFFSVGYNYFFATLYNYGTAEVAIKYSFFRNNECKCLTPGL